MAWESSIFGFFGKGWLPVKEFFEGMLAQKELEHGASFLVPQLQHAIGYLSTNNKVRIFIWPRRHPRTRDLEVWLADISPSASTDHRTISYVNITLLSPRKFRNVGVESSNKAVRNLAISRRWMKPSASVYWHMSRHELKLGLLIALVDHLHHNFRSQHSLTRSYSKFYYLSKKAESICSCFQNFSAT